MGCELIGDYVSKGPRVHSGVIFRNLSPRTEMFGNNIVTIKRRLAPI